MRNYKTEGIILKRSNFGEADRLVTFFSKHYGKMKILAKGIRRIRSRRAPHLELFNQTTIFLSHGRNFDIVTEAQAVNSFSNLKKDLVKVQAAYRISELVNELCPEHQESFPIYNLLIDALSAVEDSGKSVNSTLVWFSLNLLWDLGFLPKGKTLSSAQIDPFIENIIEKKLKTGNGFSDLKNS